LARVQKAIDKLGYLPNRVAGSLSSKRSNIVGLIVPGINNSLYASTAQAVGEVLRSRGFHLMIARGGHDPLEEEAAISAFLSQQVCGLILHGTNHTHRAATLIKTARHVRQLLGICGRESNGRASGAVRLPADRLRQPAGAKQ
jgi:LacI family gluconate utilization system Gnt-I transcriptional repressor